MARKRLRGTLVDYLVAAIEPFLIMAMVGSLMFFLLDLWYHGPFLERLQWIVFWFVFGIVLITRVSMMIGTSLAMGYGVALGGAVTLVACRLTGFQPLLFVILGIVWWITHKLTFDCTLLDDDQDSGVGLLQESGLDSEATEEPSAAPAAGDPAAMHASLLPRHSWWKIWRGDSRAAKRPNAPGVWLVYFTLGSLPVFGLAQWFVPAVEEERRTWLFLCFLAYIASGMGLLLATSFLNLRRYLRQRRLKMPAAMTATWLSTGSIFVIGLTALAAALPFSGTGWRILRGATREGTDLRASRHAILKDSAVQGEGARSEGAAASKAENAPSNQEKTGQSGNSNDANAKQQTSGKGREGGEKGPGQAKRGAPRGKPASSQAGKAGPKGAPKDNASDQGKKGSGRSDTESERNKEAAESAKSEEAAESKENRDGSDQSAQEPRETPNQTPRLPSLSINSSPLLRGLLIGAAAIALFFGLWRHGLAILLALRDLLASLFGGFFLPEREKRTKQAEAAPAAAAPPPARPFASFANPFANGLAKKFSPNDLVLYSYEALEAWAHDHSQPRLDNETPMEFLDRVGASQADLGQHAAPVVGYYVAIVYGHRGVQSEALPALRQFWTTIQGLA
jgi:hypothetical protein